MQAQQSSSPRTTIRTAREKVRKVPVDCVDILLSASVTIPDTSGKLHSFSENQTSLETELRVHKRELVRVDGENSTSEQYLSILSLQETAASVSTPRGRGPDNCRPSSLMENITLRWRSSDLCTWWSVSGELL